jgi:hypothetical protein
MAKRLNLGNNGSLRKKSKAEEGRCVHLRSSFACRVQIRGGHDSVYIVPLTCLPKTAMELRS